MIRCRAALLSKCQTGCTCFKAKPLPAAPQPLLFGQYLGLGLGNSAVGVLLLGVETNSEVEKEAADAELKRKEEAIQAGSCMLGCRCVCFV